MYMTVSNMIFVTDATFFFDSWLFVLNANILLLVETVTLPNDLVTILRCYAEDTNRVHVLLRNQGRD